MLRNPEDHLGAPGGAERLDPTGERVSRAKDVGDDPRASLDRGAGRARCPHPRRVAGDHLGRAPDVPEHGDQDVELASDPADVLVERPPEAFLVLWRHERVDEDDAVGRLAEDGPDILLPLLVVARPAPQTDVDARDFHAANGRENPKRYALRIVVSQHLSRRRDRMRLLRLALIASLAVFALAAAGCGGDDDEAIDETTTLTEPTETDDDGRGRNHDQRHRRPGLRHQRGPDLGRSREATRSRSRTSPTSTTSI